MGNVGALDDAVGLFTSSPIKTFSGSSFLEELRKSVFLDEGKLDDSIIETLSDPHPRSISTWLYSDVLVCEAEQESATLAE